MNRIFGLTIYTLNNSNLEGQWMNNRVTLFQDEICTRTNNSGATEFVGEYKSVWTDSTGQITARLVIRLNENDQLVLNWDRLQNAISGAISTTYTGFGTIRDNQLICSYVMVNN